MLSSSFYSSYHSHVSAVLVNLSCKILKLKFAHLSRVSKRAGKITLDPSHPAHSLFELLPSGRRYRALSTRTTTQNSSSPSNPSQEHLTINVEHTTLFYNYFTTIIHHTYIYNIFYLFFSISNLHVRPVHTWLSVLHSVFAILYIAYLIYLYIVLLLSVSCPVAVILLHCGACHYNKFLVCVNIPGHKAHSDSDSDSENVTLCCTMLCCVCVFFSIIYYIVASIWLSNSPCLIYRSNIWLPLASFLQDHSSRKLI